MIREQLSGDLQSRYDQLRTEVAQLTAKIAILQPAQVYAIKPQQPEPTHLLARGNPAQPKEVIGPGGISSLSALSADFSLPVDAAEGDRRKKLAQWITDSRNPIFARVMVSRLWHYHFGVGLVDTPKRLWL